MSAAAEEHAVDLEESEDFKSMRRQDTVWTGSKLIVVLVVTLAIALTVIYGIASMGSG